MQDLDPLSPQQRQVIVALLSGVPITRAARAAEVDPSSIYRWLKQPVFQDELRAGRRELVRLGLAQLQGLLADAVTVVREILTDSARPATIRLRAAELVIEHTARYLETDELERRIQELERLLEAP